MKRKIFKIIADLRFAIIILLVIAFSSILGTLIEQDQSIEVYKSNYPLTNPALGFLSWDLILKYGFDHVYKTWWFIFLIFLFGTSLLICTFLQQFPSLKIARRCQFLKTKRQFDKLRISQVVSSSKLNKLLFEIKNNQYSIFHQKNIIYCYKGLVGRLAPIIVHFSMILILTGSVIGAIGGFKAQEIVPKTEMFYIQNILTNGKFTKIPKLSTRINDFWITYSKQRTINQFYSNLSILNNNGKEIKQKTVFVNSPAQFQNITFYQTDWNLVGLRVKSKNSLINQYLLINISTSKDKVWLSWIPIDQNVNNGFTILTNSLEGYCSVYNTLGQFIGNLELNETLKNNSYLTLLDILSSTGIQIKSDPGIPIIYLGFGILMLSTLVSYVSYSQIWMIIEIGELLIGGNTTRAILDFEFEFSKLFK